MGSDPPDSPITLQTVNTTGFSTFSIFPSIFGFIVAAISLFAFLVNICRSHLPSYRVNELESVLNETDTLFKKAAEDGLLTEPAFIHPTEHDLRKYMYPFCASSLHNIPTFRGLRMKAHRLQSRTYNATALRQDYLKFFSRIPKSVRSTCQSLKRLRARVFVRVFDSML